jgi:hypothetical protein
MTDRAGPAYRDEIAAAYARIESLEAEARARSVAAAERELTDDERLTQLEDHARRWDRVRTTLALVLGVSTLVAFHLSERWGSPAAVLFASVIMVSVGVTLAWPSLSMRAAVGPRAARAHKRSATGVRVSLSGGADAQESAARAKAERGSPAAMDAQAQRASAPAPDRGRVR